MDGLVLYKTGDPWLSRSPIRPSDRITGFFEDARVLMKNLTTLTETSIRGLMSNLSVSNVHIIKWMGLKKNP